VALSKVKMLDEINLINATMQMHLVKAKAAIVLPDNPETLKNPYIQEGYKWIMEIFHNEYKAVCQIRSQQSEAIWERYEKWEGFDDHAEVVIYKRELSKLRKAIVSRKRPTLFKKGAIDGVRKRIEKENKRRNKLQKAKSAS